MCQYKTSRQYVKRSIKLSDLTLDKPVNDSKRSEKVTNRWIILTRRLINRS